MTDALPAFPPRDAPLLRISSSMTQAGFGLRRAAQDDLPFLRVLYAQTRREELAAVPWPAPIREQFLDDQFALQHRHYVQHFPQADFLVVTRESDSIGRLYVQMVPEVHLIDIALMENERSHGLGSALIGAMQDHARRQACDMHLHVAAHNHGALRLYRRMGFRLLPAENHYLPMRWAPDQLNTA